MTLDNLDTCIAITCGVRAVSDNILSSKSTSDHGRSRSNTHVIDISMKALYEMYGTSFFTYTTVTDLITHSNFIEYVKKYSIIYV